MSMLENMPIEYKVCSSKDSDELSKMVTELLNQGWTLQGPIVSTGSQGSYGHSTNYAQALVRGMIGGGKKATRKNRNNSRKWNYEAWIALPILKLLRNRI